jgi:hypothetical protein
MKLRSDLEANCFQYLRRQNNQSLLYLLKSECFLIGVRFLNWAAFDGVESSAFALGFVFPPEVLFGKPVLASHFFCAQTRNTCGAKTTHFQLFL